jgi:hypothetical protein
MQYLLSEEELRELVSRPTTAQTAKIQDVNNMLRLKVLQFTNSKCIHHKDIAKYVEYCDKCPVIQKEDGGGVDWRNYEMLCTLRKEFSK